MPERAKETLIYNHSDYLLKTLADCKKAVEGGQLYSSFIQTAQKVLDYTGLANPNSFDPARYVMRGNVVSILPQDFSIHEKLLAEKTTEQAAESVRKLRSQLGLKLYKQQPLTTVIVANCIETERTVVPTRPQMAGVISLTMPLLFNTFNLEAAKFAEKVYGKDKGKKIAQFSYEHELAHQVYSSNQANLSEIGENSSVETVSEWYGTYQTNEIFWEIWANQLPNHNKSLFINGKPIFPDFVAQSYTDYGFSGKEIFELGKFDTFSGNFGSTYHNGQHNYPFVMDPADAQEYLKVTDYLRETKKPAIPLAVQIIYF